MENQKINRNLIKILKIFNKHPYMFINFLNNNHALTDSFKLKLSRCNIKDKPKISDIEKMVDYYLHMIDYENDKENNELKIKDWNNKLILAINEQRFEDAANIRDYMISKGYKIII